MCNRLNREELTDEELIDELDDDMMEGAETGGTPEGSSQHVGPDVGLSVQEKRTCYESPSWRIQVRKERERGYKRESLLHIKLVMLFNMIMSSFCVDT